MIFRTITDESTGAVKSIGLFGKTLNELKSSFANIKSNGLFKTSSIDNEAIDAYNKIITEAIKNNVSMADKQQIMKTAMEGTNKETARLISSTKGLIVTDEALTKAQDANTLSFKASEAVLKTLSIAGNMLAMWLVSVAIEGVVTGLDNLIHRAEKSKEKINEANGKYEESKSKLETLNSELSTTSQRIDELNSKENLTFTEQAELENLKAQNEELKRSIELEKLKNKEALNDTVKEISNEYDTYRKQYQEVESEDNARKRIQDDLKAAQKEIDQADTWLSGEVLTNYVADKQKQIKLYEQQLAEFDKNQKDYYTGNKEEYLDYASQLEGWINTYEEKGIKNLSQKENETYASMVSDLDNIYKNVLSKSEYYEIKIKPIMEDESLQASINQITDYFKNGGSIDGLEDVFSGNIKELNTACENAGISFSDFIKNLYAQAGNSTGLSFAPLIQKPNSAADAQSNLQSKEKINYYNSLDSDTRASIDNGQIQLYADDSLEDVQAKVDTWKENVEGNNIAINFVANISDAEKDFSSLANAYTDFADRKEIDASNLSGLTEAFGELPDFDKYIETITDIGSTTEDVQNAFDNLAASYIDNSGILEDLTRENADYIASQLEAMGITNSQELIESRLAEKYGYESQQQQELINTSKALGNAKYNTSNASTVLQNASLSDAIAFANEAAQAGVANSALIALAMSKFNSNGIITANECNALAALAAQAGISAAAFYELAAAKQAAENGTGGGSGGNVYAQEQALKGKKANAENAARLAAYKFKNGKVSASYNSGGSAGGSGGGGGSSAASKTAIDWIARKLEHLQKVIDITKAKLENLFTIDKKASTIDKQIKQTTSLSNANATAAKKYKKYADSVKLSGNLKKKVRNGNYNIKEYDSNTADKINKYKEYYDNYLDAKKKTDELKGEIRKLKEQKYQLYVDDAKANIEKLNASSDISTDFKTQNKYLDEQKSYLKTSYDYQIKIAQLTKNQIEADKLEAEYQKELIKLEKQKFDNIQDYYDNQSKLLDHQITSIDNKISEIETSGTNVNRSYYESQKELNEQKKKQYEEEKALLEKQIADIPQGTEEWYDAKDAIQDCENAISKCVEETYNLNNAINELHFNMFDDIADSVDRIITEQEFLQSLFAHEKLTDEKAGTLTDAGFAKLGSLSASYYASKEKANNDEELLNDLQNVKANGRQADGTYKLGKWSFNSLDDLEDKINEVYATWQDDIKDTYRLETDIADLMKDKYQAELDWLQELIDAKKEALDAEKDLHDYQQSIQEKTKDISTIQKQIAAYEGDTSQEGLAKLQKLQVALSEKENDLRETEYDRYISDQQDMLDKLYEEYEELVTKKLDDFMSLVQEGLELSNNNTSLISEYLSNVAASNGYTEETKGLFTTIAGSIGNSTAKIISAIENKIIANSGTQTDTTTQPEPASGNTSLTHTGFHALDSASLPLSDLTINNSFTTTPAAALKASTTQSNSGKTDVLKEITSSNKLKTSGNVLLGALKQLDIGKFAKGGIAKFAKSQGEDGFVLARDGEGFVPPEKVPQIQELLNTVPLMTNVMQPLAKIPNISAVTPVGNTIQNTIDMTVTLPNVENYDQFVSQLQKDNKFEKMIQDISTNRLAGGGRLLKYKQVL